MNDRLGVSWKPGLSEKPEASPSAGLVLIPRGNAPDDDEISVSSAALRDQRRSYAPSLTLTGSSSSKRKIIGSTKDLLSPATAGMTTAASPTTQIARKIDSIHLDARTPVGHSASGLPVVQVSEETGMDEFDEECCGPMSLVMSSEEETHEQEGGRREKSDLSQKLLQQSPSGEPGPVCVCGGGGWCCRKWCHLLWAFAGSS